MFFSICAILNLCFSQSVRLSIGVFLNLCDSHSVLFSISVFLNLCDSQLVFFSICAILNLCNSQLVFFSIKAVWGRHRQLDDSLVGQLTNIDVKKEYILENLFKTLQGWRRWWWSDQQRGVVRCADQGGKEGHKVDREAIVDRTIQTQTQKQIQIHFYKHKYVPCKAGKKVTR